jgi:hypothetical protein
MQTTTATTTVEIAAPATQLAPHFQDVPTPSAVDLVAEFKGAIATDGITKRVIFKDGRVVFSGSDLPHNVAFTFDDDGVLCGVELLING